MLDLIYGAQAHHSPTLAISVCLLGMVALAGYDVWRERVEDWATVALFALSIVCLAADRISPQQWLSGILSAAVAFTVYLFLGTRGVMGGGDVKLSAVPALVLGASNPFLGVWWIACTILVHQALLLSVTGRRKTALAGGARPAPIALPHVPAMAAAMVLSTVAIPASFS